jgi:hypothetical protein
MEAGKNKIIPEKYKRPILIALSFYPELEDVKIHFRLTNHNSMLYSTKPSLGSVFLPPSKRTYNVCLLEKAEEPHRSALFKNLTEEMQIAVIAHELIHVIQFHSCSAPKLIKKLLSYPFPGPKKKMERDADIGAITHGQGEGLYQHAVYLRSIPGYLEKRPEIDKYYLKPAEIRKYLEEFESQKDRSFSNIEQVKK